MEKRGLKHEQQWMEQQLWSFFAWHSSPEYLTLPPAQETSLSSCSEIIFLFIFSLGVKTSQFYICWWWTPDHSKSQQNSVTQSSPLHSGGEQRSKRWKPVKLGNSTPNSSFLSNCRGVAQNHTMQCNSGVRMFTVGWQEQKMDQEGLRRKGVCIPTSPWQRLCPSGLVLVPPQTQHYLKVPNSACSDTNRNEAALPPHSGTGCKLGRM